MPIRNHLLAALLLAVFLAGCAAPGPSRPFEGEQDASWSRVDAQRVPAELAFDSEPLGVDSADESVHEIEPGTGEFINTEAARRRAPPVDESGEISLNFENAQIPDVVKAILGEVLQESYVIVPGVGGIVTFSTARPIKREQALSVLEMLLSWNNASLVQVSGEWRVVPTAMAIPGQLAPRLAASEPPRGYEVRAIPLRFIAASEMEKILQPYLRPGALVRVDNSRSLIIVAGTSQELRSYENTVDVFDVDWLKGMSVGLFRLQAVEAATVVTELQVVFGEQGQSPLAGLFRFLPIERLNAVMVITSQPYYLEKAEEWIERLDRGGDGTGERLYVYDVKNVKAVDLADQLMGIFTGGTSSRQSRGQSAASGAVAPGLKAVEVSSLSSGTQVQQTAGSESAPSGAGDDGGLSLGGGDDVKITAVEENNQLLIRGTPSQYRAILGATKRLDTIPLQVHIETRILDVTLGSNLSYGVQSFLQSLSGGAAVDDPIIGRTRRYNLGGTVSGGGPAPFTFTYLEPDLTLALTALQSVTSVKTLSAPSLIVLNNKEAKINVGTQIPITTTFFNNNSVGLPGGGISQGTQSSVQYLQTGTILTITPRVNPGGLVFLEVSQEVSNPGSAPAGVNPPVNQRTIDTEVAVQSGEVLVLGGLISESEDRSRAGTPGLSQIPLIGALFGQHDRGASRSELLVLIKPTVIRDPAEARAITDEYRQRFERLEPISRFRDQTETREPRR